MSTPFESEILAANAKYVSTYTHGGLECPPKKKAVISKWSLIQKPSENFQTNTFSQLHAWIAVLILNQPWGLSLVK
jgi:hypothetical protein